MNGRIVVILALIIAVLAAGAGLVQAHGGRYWDEGGRGWGHMGGRHMMDYYDRSPGLGGCWNDGQRQGLRADITKEEARDLVENRVSRNPYLAVGKIVENEDGFEVQVVTKKGSELVNRIQVEKDTGRLYRIFE
jgi:hypothetical protein